MTFTVEVLLKDRQHPVVETLEHQGNEPDRWTEDDARAVLTQLLLAIDRVKNPDPKTERTVALRGFSWIVSPYTGGVVIAVEIPSGAVVAGPFAVAQARLDLLITRALAVPADS